MEAYSSGKTDVAPSTGPTTIMTPIVPYGIEVHIVSVMARDVDHAVATSIELGIMSGTAKTPIDATAGSFPANTSHNISFGFSLLPGQRVYATFNNATQGDRLELFIFGFAKSIMCEDGELKEFIAFVHPGIKGR